MNSNWASFLHLVRGEATTETTTINQAGVIVSCRKVAEQPTLMNVMQLGHGYGPGDVVELIEGMPRAQSMFVPLA